MFILIVSLTNMKRLNNNRIKFPNSNIAVTEKNTLSFLKQKNKMIRRIFK